MLRFWSRSSLRSVKALTVWTPNQWEAFCLTRGLRCVKCDRLPPINSFFFENLCERCAPKKSPNAVWRLLRGFAVRAGVVQGP